MTAAEIKNRLAATASDLSALGTLADESERSMVSTPTNPRLQPLFAARSGNEDLRSLAAGLDVLAQDLAGLRAEITATLPAAPAAPMPPAG